MKKIICSVLLVATAFAACKKKDPAPDPLPTPVKTVPKFIILTTDKWKVSAVYMSKGADTIVNYYQTMKECEKDNFITFNASGSISSDEGATKCDPSVAQITTDGRWLLNADTTEFIIQDSKVLPITGAAIAKIVLIDSLNFRISKDTSGTYPGIGTISGTIFANFQKVK